MAHLRGRERAHYVARMFGRISRRYDRLNTVMTVGRHHAWRRLATEVAVARPVPSSAGGLSGPALDVATGTGDFAIELARQPQVTAVIGLDFNLEMMSRALRKTRENGQVGRISYVLGDAHALPFPDNHFVCATVGFGIRNFVDVPRALKEMVRVVVPGGRVVTLEMVRTDGNGLVSRLFPFCFRHVTPLLGALLAEDREAYTYLPESVQGFLSAAEVTTMMEKAGLYHVIHRRLALGAVAIHAGEVRE